MLVRLIALAVLLATLFGGIAPALAQDATPVAGDAGATGDTFTVLAETAVPDLPADASFVGLVRLTFAPGSASPVGPDPGPVLTYVEEGSIVAAIDGPFDLVQAAGQATPQAASASEDEIVLRAGDSVSVPGGVSTQYRNEADEPASVLVVLLFPFDPFGPAGGGLGGGGISAEPLVGRSLESLPDGPTAIALARQTFGPIGGFEPSESAGPVLAYVESGRLTYTVASGDSEVTRGDGAGERLPEPMAEGSQTELGPGDAFAEEGGTVSGGRAAGEEPVNHLVVFIWPLDVWAPAPDASPVPGATPVQ